ncbi:MAG: thioredoxin family protein [Bacteroidota bacterium]
MKPLAVIALVMLFLPSFAQDNTSQLDWLTNLDEAKVIAKEKKRPILVYFNGSDWCAPCKALKSDFFETEEFALRAENLVLVMIDYPRRVDIITQEQRTYNKKIIDTYNPEKAFPTLLMLNRKGKELGKLGGYSSFNSYKDTSHHFSFVDEFLPK